MKFAVSVIVITLSMYIVGYSAESCKTSPTTFATKTSYDDVGNKDINVIKPQPSCRPVQINAVHRHGHRYPSASHILGQQKLIEKLNKKAEIIKSRFNITFPLKCPFEVAQSKLLTHVGEQDTYQIGKRIKKRFPELFRKSYTPLVYKFRSTCKFRCVQTTNSLAFAYFEHAGTLGATKYQPIAIKVEDCPRDALLSPWNVCKKWIQDMAVHKHKWLKEYYKYINGEEIKKLNAKINRKLGFRHSSTNLDLDDMKVMFELCAYHINMFQGSLGNGMCSLLDKEDIRVIEYLHDLDYFYSYSAGHELNYKMYCPLVSDIYHSLQDARYNKTGAYTGVFRVAHQETLESLLTLLGVYIKHGETLKASNYEKMKNRTFRSACMAPYSGNLYFTLYKCIDGEYKVQLYVNENLVRIPCCKSATDCKFEVFLNCYKKIVHDCNFKRMCEN